MSQRGDFAGVPAWLLAPRDDSGLVTLDHLRAAPAVCAFVGLMCEATSRAIVSDDHNTPFAIGLTAAACETPSVLAGASAWLYDAIYYCREIPEDVHFASQTAAQFVLTSSSAGDEDLLHLARALTGTNLVCGAPVAPVRVLEQLRRAASLDRIEC